MAARVCGAKRRSQQMVAIVFTHQHFVFAFSHVCTKEKAVIEFLMALHIVH